MECNWHPQQFAGGTSSLESRRISPRYSRRYPQSVPTGLSLAADRVLTALALLFAAYLLLHLVGFQYGRDQGIYSVVADRLLQGEAPYHGTWDFKPPGIFFVFALAQMLFGRGMHAVRILEAVGFASLIYAFAIFSRRHVGSARPGIVGGAFAVLMHVQLEFWHTAQPSSFGAVVLAWALVCATYTPNENRRDRKARQAAAWATAGVLYAAAALLKPPLGGGFLVSLTIVGLHQWQSHVGPRRWKSLTAPVIAFGAGAVIPLLSLGIYFTAKDAWGDLYDTLFVFAPRYTALSLQAVPFGRLLLHAVEEWAFAFSALSVAGLVLLIAMPKLGQREREGVLHVAGLVGFILLGVALQAKFFPYHYGAALPLTGLLAGWGFWKLWIRVNTRPLGIALVAVPVALLIGVHTATRHLPDSFWARCQMRLIALLEPDIRSVVNDHLYSIAEVNIGANRQVAKWLEAHTSPDASVYIWGFEPVIYKLAKRRPASRYIYNVPQRVAWARETSRPALLVDLVNSAPAAIVVEHGDRFPWVTGDFLDSAEVLQGFPALESLLRQTYEPAGTIERFDLYLLRSAPPSGPPLGASSKGTANSLGAAAAPGSVVMTAGGLAALPVQRCEEDKGELSK